MSNIVVSTLLISILALSAVMLLLFAFVLWFAELINSLTLALLLTGVTLAIGAWLSYKLTLSPILKELREEYQKAMAIVSIIKMGYECAVKRVSQLFTLLK